MIRLRLVLLAVLALVAVCPSTAAQAGGIAAKTATYEKIDGYMPLYWDAATGKMFLEISRFNTEILYQVSLPAGVGSNPLGLDRGQLGRTHVVSFERVGPKVLMVEANYRFRAISDDPAERRAVADSFARSVLWGFKVEAAEGDRVLVDATAFFLRDAHGVADRMRQSRQGNYRLDESRSAFFLSRTKGFPKNTEVETTLTFAGDGELGRLVGEVTPTANALTVREHHSLVELPEAGYKPRTLDPRVGMIGLMFHDYASPFGDPIEKRWVTRHRLQKKDPSAAVSEPVKPIVYYVDNGAPEPIRSALVEGASWWNQAFEAAGYKNAFQVKVLPADADPMDIRYNMINWVHRSTRGWSYGASVRDPRTGEIIKGNVSLGSLRIRQDMLLATGMIPPYDQAKNGSSDQTNQCEFGDSPVPEYLAAFDPATDASAMALARIRQLSAHEVGHTLGFAHNFAASTYGRASVMDYPAPMVEIRNGKLDLSNAYAVGIGAYDKFAVTFAYAEFPTGADERAELEKIVQKGLTEGMLFLSDDDARPAGAANPLANLWDNGRDPIASLKHEMEVRRIGLDQFGLGNIPNGTPLSLLEAKFLPLYLHHRYQVQAAVKSVGGLDYTFAVKTAAGVSPKQPRAIVPAERQRAALKTLLSTIDLDALVIPKRILDLMPPTAYGYDDGPAEYFAKRTDPVFDPIAAATIAADVPISGLLQPQRAARLIEFHGHDGKNPDFKEIIDALLDATWKAPIPADGYRLAIQQAVQTVVVTRLMDLAANDDAAPRVRAEASAGLRNILGLLKSPVGVKIEAAHRRATQDDIERFLARPETPNKTTKALPIPQGDPIGEK